MIRTKLKAIIGRCLACLIPGAMVPMVWFWAAQAVIAAEPAAPSESGPFYDVQGYTVEGKVVLSTNVLAPLFARYTGTNVSLTKIVQAASELQTAYQSQGYPTVNIVIAQSKITNGLVTLDVFQGAIAQIVVSGRRYLNSGMPAETETNLPGFEASPVTETAAGNAATNKVPPMHPVLTSPASAEQIAAARAALFQKVEDLKDTRIHVASTNTGPHFQVDRYLVTGNSVLPPNTLALTLTNIDGAYGTNVSIDGIRTAVEQLQIAYHEHGYVTVAVSLPPQKLTNAEVKIKVTEGRLAGIDVKGNRFFSSNNVMRALPSLHTNMILNSLVFQAELNRANSDPDRQIYPVIGPGPDPGTSAITLRVKDQLPLHGKLELNNQSTPETPALRLNSSAVANDLWQLDHSLGIQYSFSPELYKQGSQWDFYDLPLVANYSAFYRMPLGSPVSIEDQIDNSPGNFGYDEATRKFNLPPYSSQPSLSFFASRATIDTGVSASPDAIIGVTSQTNLDDSVVTNSTLSSSSTHQDLTINNDLGARFSFPLVAPANYQSVISGGFDYKTYSVSSSATNVFTVVTKEINYSSSPVSTNTVVSVDNSPVPYTRKDMDYLPLMARYDLSGRNWMGPATFGVGFSANAWFTSQTLISTNGVLKSSYNGASSVQQITGSSESTGYWVTVTPSFSQEIMFFTNWMTSIRADGQWASEPLISNEQFGIGGVNSVRGYHEGEAFGDTGWHVSLEQQSPPHTIGMVYPNAPLSVRGSIYMDYGHVYLLDPQGQPGGTELWGTGFGLIASVGPTWQARFLFSVPLIGTSTTERDQPYFNFSLTGQF